MNYDPVVFRNKREAFEAIWKKIEPYVKKRPLTKTGSKRRGYIRDFVATYNDITTYLLKAHITEKDLDAKIEHQDNQVTALKNLKKV